MKFLKMLFGLIALACMLAVTFGTIILSENGNLPFLPDEEVSFITENESDGEFVSAESEAGYVSEEISEEVSEEPKTDLFALFMSKTENVETAVPFDGVYDSAKNKTVLVAAPESIVKSTELETRMGYIFADGKVYDSLLCDITAVTDGYTLSHERDMLDRPLFEKDGKYYYINSDGVMTASDFDYYTESRFFEFDAPSYLGKAETGIVRTYESENDEGKRYGYYADKTNYASRCVCAYAFSYVPGTDRRYGCVIEKIEKENRLVIISDKFYLQTKSNVITDIYYPAEKFDLSAIGYYYFDDGFVRVKVKNGSYFYEGLSDYKGELLNIVSGYTLEAYSDSILLLKNADGKYGYMTNTENWITDPIYTEANPFLEGVATVKTQSGYWGAIDRDGDYIIEPVFDKVLNCSAGIIACFKENYGWYIFVNVTED